MPARALVFVLIILTSKPIENETPDRWIIWNVGQGQWVTHINHQGCWHFDMGGERAPWSKLMNLCRSRANFLFLSHWDWDHIGFSARATFFLPNLCRWPLPKETSNKKKSKMVGRLPECSGQTPFFIWSPENAKTANDLSRVVLWNGFLIPGDSSQAIEKTWVGDFSDLDRVRVLILGHHGSRTSTSHALLSQLTRLKMAFASARRRRYGHPHRETEKKVRRYGVPVLSTEDWGHIHIW